MSNLPEIARLTEEIQRLAKEEWGEQYIDCDCGHECECDCYICTDGWGLTEYREIHTWEKELMPIITSRDVAKYKTEGDERQ